MTLLISFDYADEIAESVYILTRQGAPDERKWRIGQAIVVGESDVPCLKLNSRFKDQYPSSIPASSSSISIRDALEKMLSGF